MTTRDFLKRVALPGILALAGTFVGCGSSHPGGPGGAGGKAGTPGMAPGDGGGAGSSSGGIGGTNYGGTGSGGTGDGLDSGQADMGDAVDAGSAGGGAATVEVTSDQVSGGICPRLAAWTPPTCGVCGNGLLDSCTVPLPCHDGPPGSCGTGTQTESCDGNALGDATCTTLGFSGGALGCDLGCFFDTRLCQSCGTDAHITSCTEAFDCAVGRSLALAANNDTVALSWVSGDPPGAVDIAILSADLSEVGHRRFTTITDGIKVALAATPSGFVLAVEHGRQQVELIPLTQNGSVRGSTTHIDSAYDPMLAARGTGNTITGGPLLGFVNGDAARMVVLLTDDGVFETTPVEVGAAGTVSTATFTGDGFLYALDGNYAGLTRIGLDGRVAATAQFGVGLSESPDLTWGGDHAVMTFVDWSEGMVLQSFDASGNALASPIILGSASTQGNRSPVLALPDGDLAVLLGGFTGEVDHSLALTMVRLNAAGAARYQPFTLVSDPLRVATWKVARRASDVIVAWLGSADQTNDHTRGGLHVARVVP